MYLLICMIILALVTYIPRSLPLILNKQIKSNYIKSFLYYMPYCVLATMTFPSILYSTQSFLFSLIGTLVAIFFAYKEKSLIQVAMLSALTIYAFNLLF